MQGLSLAIVSYLFASHGQGGPAHGPPAEPGRLPRLQSEALMVFIEDFLSHDIGLVDTAAVVGYSADHFARLSPPDLPGVALSVFAQPARGRCIALD